jgi:hypothetical protein
MKNFAEQGRGDKPMSGEEAEGRQEEAQAEAPGAEETVEKSPADPEGEVEGQKTEAGRLEEVRERIQDGALGERTEREKAAEGSGEKNRDGLWAEVRGKDGSFAEKFEKLRTLQQLGYKFEAKGLRNILSQKTAERDATRDKREEFAVGIIGAIEDARIEGRLPEDFWDGIDQLISVGAGHGNNPYNILNAYLAPEARALFIDPEAAPTQDMLQSGRVVHLGQRFEDVKLTSASGEKNLVEASNFLQLYETEAQKIEQLKKMIRLAGVGGKLLIVDEVKREGWSGTKDWMMNRGFNAFKGNYARLQPGRYEKIFAELGLKCFTSEKTDQYERGSVLFALEVTEEAMGKAVAE